MDQIRSSGISLNPFVSATVANLITTTFEQTAVTACGTEELSAMTFTAYVMMMMPDPRLWTALIQAYVHNNESNLGP